MTRWLTLGGVLFALFVALGITVAGQPLAVDLAVAAAFQGLWRGTTGQVTTVVSDAFGIVVPDVFAMALLVACVWCWHRGLRRELLVLARVLLVVLPCRLISTAGKELFARVRPREYAQFSYPSGHVVAAASTGFAAVLLCVWLASRVTRRVAVVSAIITAMVAVTRLVLGVHWLTDTIGAVLGVLGVGLPVAATVRLLPGPVPAVTGSA
ncbi:MAG TPA: phosphatase PAP2 family protein [Amycolatopsis sp.]|uniref:phosphatase PAP2 family protein n=1 Tax=Amycolatopsis sp. TaxID=37632 RepID=UPI002B46C36B|nr:phosphatase PAP2 family protein [Amycolatopsis sp.]HKS48900.1 phosphatase PAP2 family protein [Amycolatopsis sp.]